MVKSKSSPNVITHKLSSIATAAVFQW